MKLKNLNKAVAVGVVALTATTGLIATTIPAALADPTRPYAAAGSDTIQDVWNGLTNDFGAVEPSIASWNAFVSPNLTGAVPDAYIQTKSGGAWFLRPSGSGAGVTALSDTWDTADNASHTYTPASGAVSQLNHEDVDFARSSSGPATGSGLTYLPFARDAVTVAFNPTTGLTSANFSEQDLHIIYSGVQDASDPNVTFTGLSGGTTGTALATSHVFFKGTEVHPIIPQSGSGTRKFFLGAIGVSNSVGAEAPYISDPGTTAQGGVPENNGTSIPAAGDIMPFSAAQWIAQADSSATGIPVTNTTTGLSLATLNLGTGSLASVSATNGSGTALTPGPLFGATNLSGAFTTPPSSGVGVFNRDTYDVVPSSFLGGSATPKQQALVSILGSGIGGAAGSQVIQNFGFGVLSYIGTSSNFLSGKFTP